MSVRTRLRVAVVDSHETTRRAIAPMLAGDPRLRVLDPVARLSDLAGLAHDVRLLDLLGVGPVDEVRASLADGVPTVVHSAGADARTRVAAWVSGATNVVVKGLDGAQLADVLCTAVTHPYRLSPVLAQAIVDEEAEVSERLRGLLDQVRRGRRLVAALRSARLTETEYDEEIRALRAEMGRSGLGELRLDPDGAPPEAMAMPVAQREALTLYAQGCSLPEIQRRMNVDESTLTEHLDDAVRRMTGSAGGDDRTRMIVALLISGLHRRPEMLRGALLAE